MYQNFRMPDALEKLHAGEVGIVYRDKILAFGKDSWVALKKAKKVMPDIEDKVFLIYHVYRKGPRV